MKDSEFLREVRKRYAGRRLAVPCSNGPGICACLYSTEHRGKELVHTLNWQAYKVALNFDVHLGWGVWLEDWLELNSPEFREERKTLSVRDYGLKMQATRLAWLDWLIGQYEKEELT